MHSFNTHNRHSFTSNTDDDDWVRNATKVIEKRRKKVPRERRAYLLLAQLKTLNSSTRWQQDLGAGNCVDTSGKGASAPADGAELLLGSSASSGGMPRWDWVRGAREDYTSMRERVWCAGVWCSTVHTVCLDHISLVQCWSFPSGEQMRRRNAVPSTTTTKQRLPPAMVEVVAWGRHSDRKITAPALDAESLWMLSAASRQQQPPPAQQASRRRVYTHPAPLPLLHHTCPTGSSYPFSHLPLSFSLFPSKSSPLSP